MATRNRAVSSLVAQVLAAAAVAASVALPAVDHAHAAPQLCPPTFDWCIGDGEPGPEPGPDPAPGPEEEPLGCGEAWRTVDPPDGDYVSYLGDGLQGDPPPGASVIWQVTFCATRFGLTPMYRWLPVITPEIVANDLWVELSGTLPVPAVGSDPAPGVNAIVDVPVFVEVTNWTGTLNPTRCEVGFCVSVTVTPTLVYRPGEPDSTSVACAGAGSRYDPQGPDIEEQAAVPGACAHAYRYRTGASGRPAEWPAAVDVTWTITWTSTAGNGGSLPSVTRTSTVPRGVDEVQTVVVGGEES